MILRVCSASTLSGEAPGGGLPAALPGLLFVCAVSDIQAACGMLGGNLSHPEPPPQRPDCSHRGCVFMSSWLIISGPHSLDKEPVP